MPSASRRVSQLPNSPYAPVRAVSIAFVIDVMPTDVVFVEPNFARFHIVATLDAKLANAVTAVVTDTAFAERQDEIHPIAVGSRMPFEEKSSPFASDKAFIHFGEFCLCRIVAHQRHCTGSDAQIFRRRISGPGMEIPSGRRHTRMPQSRLHEVNTCSSIKGMARMGMAKPVG